MFCFLGWSSDIYFSLLSHFPLPSVPIPVIVSVMDESQSLSMENPL